MHEKAKKHFDTFAISEIIIIFAHEDSTVARCTWIFDTKQINNKIQYVMKKEEKDFLKKVEKLVYEQMKDKHVNCDTVCESLGITNQNLRRKLLAITGQTGGKYLLTIRMKYAQELLSKGKYSIGQVALKCGYDDANNFSRTFKRETGQKPTEFAAKHKES